jgi:hypothetical protein
MHTVELLEEALAAAKRLGYSLRQEWLGGSGGGACEVGRSKWLFLDLAQNQTEQLGMVIETLREEPAARQLSLSPELLKLLGPARQAVRSKAA